MGNNLDIARSGNSLSDVAFKKTKIPAMKKSQRALVIGASSGIGREMALWLAKNDWHVAAVARRENLLQELCAEFPNCMLANFFDANATETIAENLEEIVKQLGGMDLLVISAGTGFLNPELNLPLEQSTIKTNVDGFTAIANWGYHYFKTQGSGQIAAITSVGGLLSTPHGPAYNASKAYQINYLDSLRKKAKKECPAVTVTELRPGSVRTAMMKGEGHFWITSPSDAATIACQAILKKKRLQYISKRWKFIGVLLRMVSLWR